MGVVGADADALDRLADQLESEATALEGMHRALGRQLYSAPWRGGSADRFRQNWGGNHAGQVSRAAEFLRANARSLRDNARQQRDASGSGGGSIGWTPTPAGSSDPGDEDGPADDFAELLKDLLSALGIAGGAAEAILASLGFLDENARKMITDLLKNGVVADLLKVVGKIANIGGFIVDLFQDLSQNSQLPWDERVLHAVIEAGLPLGVDFLTDNLDKLLIPIMPGAGFIVGKVAGFIAGQAFSIADDQFHISEGAADNVLDIYQYLKEHDFDLTSIAMDQIGNGIDWIGDKAGDVGDAVGDFVGSLNPFD
jgi:hypothetical protein